ncbi:MAG: urease accessory protein UreE [Rhizobiales bacterium]|nr:urease accessory protein UreE [Hyphomicrobiales bacterium]MBI3672352.1 urease accessory protein UreE [Hyphomicrobiales bacterium]
MAWRATSFRRTGLIGGTPFDSAVLDAESRHLRRKLIRLASGAELLVDLEKPVKLEDGDCLVLEDGRLVKIAAAEEELLEVRGRDAEHLAKIAWHIGNRHLAAQIETDRLLIKPDPVIARMLRQQGARVTPVKELFAPEHGAYHSHDH